MTNSAVYVQAMKAAAKAAQQTEKNMNSNFESLVSTIEAYTKAGLNVMLLGKHGVGKTTAIRAAAKNLNMTMAYWSAPLMDPDIDLGGIPVPNRETGSLEFFRNPELDDAEIIFLDELNRASPRVLNMVFELIQFKSVHGKVLPKLKCVHTGINPPGAGAYDVQQLDEALMDRFHAFIPVEAAFPLEIVAGIIGQAKAEIMGAWYAKLDPSKYVAPRRMEYAARLHALGMPLAHAFLTPSLPVGALEMSLVKEDMNKVGIVSAKPKVLHPIDEPEIQAVLNNPDLKPLHEAFTAYAAEMGVTAEQIWDTVLEMRAEKAQESK